MKTLFALLLLCLVAGCQDSQTPPPTLPARAETGNPQRVFYVNSYNRGYPWSDGIERALHDIFQSEELSWKDMGQIEFRSYRMDSKRNARPVEIKAAALEALQQIESFKPDVVIVSDDNAVKYLVEPHLLGRQFPVVFCGVNWDTERYHLPPDQVTGMVEVQPVDRILRDLRPLARGERLAFLKADDLSARIEAEAIRLLLDVPMTSYFVHSFPEWKETYLRLQQESDILLIGNPASLPDWDAVEALRVVREETLIPSGTWDDWMAAYSLITHATRPEEQGEWAAQTALRILNGEHVAQIPQTRNTRSNITLNMPLAKRLGVRFPMSLIENATLLRE